MSTSAFVCQSPLFCGAPVVTAVAAAVQPRMALYYQPVKGDCRRSGFRCGVMRRCPAEAVAQGQRRLPWPTIRSVIDSKGSSSQRGMGSPAERRREKSCLVVVLLRKKTDLSHHSSRTLPSTARGTAHRRELGGPGRARRQGFPRGFAPIRHQPSASQHRACHRRISRSSASCPAAPGAPSGRLCSPSPSHEPPSTNDRGASTAVRRQPAQDCCWTALFAGSPRRH